MPSLAAVLQRPFNPYQIRREYESWVESVDFARLTPEEAVVAETDFLEMMRRRWLLNTSLNDPAASKAGKKK